MLMGDAPEGVSEVRNEGECLTYCVERCELLDLVFATLKLGVELCDYLIGQHGYCFCGVAMNG
jgi:hypothetical protein